MALPAKPSDPDSSLQQQQDTAKQSGKQVGVLIVEDDFLIGMQSETALTDAGFHVIGIASTAEEAVAIAREERPRLAVMDIRLAGRRDGVDAAGELFRELGVRCIFATAHDDEDTRARAERFAPLGWLAKPYTMASLVALVRRALTRGS
ncbi:response regulator [Bradyrhizobium sp. ARR65]|uniref:response regulator n=1 Tax=Bradyrhizobium sp. ARR65 TaxID=1040989 RepID=UPI001FD90831|nr:response regulator [Bradyrhizobium sp. ARR65]